MTRRSQVLTPLATGFLFGLAVILAFYSGAHADTGDHAPDVEGGIVRWYENGALAAVITAVVAVVLVMLERLSCTRWPGLAWLRRGSMRSYLSITIGAVFGFLPAVSAGTVTWGGLATALLGGLVAFRPGGGERKGEECEGGEAPT